MAAILALHSCYCPRVTFINQGGAIDNLGFSSSATTLNFKTSKRHNRNLPKPDKFYKFEVKARQTESPIKSGPNGRPNKMVPTTKVIQRKPDTVTSSKLVVNGAGLVKKETGSALMKSPKVKAQEFPPAEELKVLPSDESFSWANENYNSFQRSIDVWSFVLSLRVRVLLNEKKWAYLGGFTEDKKVSFSTLLP